MPGIVVFRGIPVVLFLQRPHASSSPTSCCKYSFSLPPFVHLVSTPLWTQSLNSTCVSAGSRCNPVDDRDLAYRLAPAQPFAKGRGSVKLNVLLDSQTFIGTGK